MLSQLSYTPARCNHHTLKRLQSLLQLHQLRLSVHSVQQWLESHNYGRLQSDNDLYIKVDEKDEQIRHRRIVAGRGILRNHGRNNNSPATREIRAKAMKLIPKLLDAIKDNAERLLQSIENAENAAEKL